MRHLRHKDKFPAKQRVVVTSSRELTGIYVRYALWDVRGALQMGCGNHGFFARWYFLFGLRINLSCDFWIFASVWNWINFWRKRRESSFCCSYIKYPWTLVELKKSECLWFIISGLSIKRFKILSPKPIQMFNFENICPSVPLPTILFLSQIQWFVTIKMTHVGPTFS